MTTPATTPAESTEIANPGDPVSIGKFDLDEVREAARAVRAAGDPKPDGEPAEGDPAPDDESDTKPTKKLPATDEPPKEEESVSKGLLALKRQESKFLEQKRQWEGEKTQLASQIDEAKKYIARVDELASGFLVNPIPLAEALGAQTQEHYQQLAEHFWAKAVGPENVPAEWKQKLGQNTTLARLAELERQNAELARSIDEREQRRALDMTQREYKQGLMGALAASTEEAPHVLAFAKDDPDAVADALYGLAELIAGEEGKVPDERRVVAQLEENIQAELGRFGDLYTRKQQAQKKQDSSPGKQTRATSKTLSTQTTPSLTGHARPSAKTTEERIRRAAETFGRMTGQI